MKKLHRKPALLALLGIAIASIGALCLPPGPAQPTVTFLLGSAHVKEDQRALALNDAVKQGHTVITASESLCEITLSDAGVVRVGENSSYVVSNRQAEEESEGELLFGRLWVSLKKLVSGHSYKIESPSSVLAVRGTAFSLEVDSSANVEVAVFSGRVDVGTHWILTNDSLFNAWVLADAEAYRQWLEADNAAAWVAELEREYEQAIADMLREEEAFRDSDQLEYENFLREEQGLAPLLPVQHGPLAEPGEGGWLDFVKAGQQLNYTADGSQRQQAAIDTIAEMANWYRLNLERDSLLGLTE
jgi:hypothetical protein